MYFLWVSIQSLGGHTDVGGLYSIELMEKASVHFLLRLLMVPCVDVVSLVHSDGIKYFLPSLKSLGDDRCSVHVFTLVFSHVLFMHTT